MENNKMMAFIKAFEKIAKDFGVNDAIKIMCGNVL